MSTKSRKISRKTANTVLNTNTGLHEDKSLNRFKRSRHGHDKRKIKRSNNDFMEEILSGPNLERECLEEPCVYSEALEYFNYLNNNFKNDIENFKEDKKTEILKRLYPNDTEYELKKSAISNIHAQDFIIIREQPCYKLCNSLGTKFCDKKAFPVECDCNEGWVGRTCDQFESFDDETSTIITTTAADTTVADTTVIDTTVADTTVADSTDQEIVTTSTPKFDLTSTTYEYFNESTTLANSTTTTPSSSNLMTFDIFIVLVIILFTKFKF